MKGSKFGFRIIACASLLILLCLVVYLFAVKLSFGWFIDGKTTNSNLSHLSATDSVRFELATIGDTSYNNQEETDIGYVDGEIFSQGSDTFYTTSTSKTHVFMRLDASSDFNNKTEESLLSPGCSGQLSFYILPKMQMEEDEIVTLEVDLKGYIINASDLLEELAGEYEYVNNILGGHILLFQNYNGVKYSNWINGEFSVNVAKNEITKVTIYWVWVPLFTNFLNEDTICEISDDVNSDYQRILTDILLNNNNKYLHFEDENKRIELLDNNNNFINVEEYSYCFNKDDEQIGRFCRYILLNLSV